MKKKLIAVIIVIFGLLALAAQVAKAEEFDYRAIKLEEVFKRHNSPLQGLGEIFIETADNYGLDWTILPAIAGTESTFAKKMPVNCNNPFGWGIYGDNRLCFESLELSIQAVGEGIGTKYNNTSLATIAPTYNSANTEGWLKNTRFFVNQIESTDIPVSKLPITL